MQLFRLAQRRFIDFHANAGFKARLGSIIGLIGFPAFYVLWTYVLPQKYESFLVRMIGWLLCLALLTLRHWPEQWKKWDPLLYYVTLFYTVPFFFTYMLLMNGASLAWNLSIVSGFVYLVILCEFLNAMILAVLGSLAAYAVFVATTGTFALPGDYLIVLPVLVFVSCGVAFLNYSDGIVVSEKMTAVSSLAAHIAHEMRTPLLGIRLDADKVAQVLPRLLEAHDWAQRTDWPGRIPRAQRDGLQAAILRISQHASAANVVIDMLLANVAASSGKAPFTECSARAVVDLALERFNFRPGQREKVDVKGNADFVFRGAEVLMMHVLFNLMKNALRAIERAGRGRITIEIVPGGATNTILFRDSGHGMSQEMARYIFVPFYTSESIGVGTGIGLSFCRTVVERMGGTISCRSQPAVGTEFTITLPAWRPALAPAA